jgi:hypothetical protein
MARNFFRPSCRNPRKAPRKPCLATRGLWMAGAWWADSPANERPKEAAAPRIARERARELT